MPPRLFCDSSLAVCSSRRSISASEIFLVTGFALVEDDEVDHQAAFAPVRVREEDFTQ